MTRRRAKDWVDDRRWHVYLAQQAHNFQNELSCWQHADLHGRDVKFFYDGQNLSAQRLCTLMNRPFEPFGVLESQRGHCRDRPATESHESSDISDQSRAAGRIETRDGKYNSRCVGFSWHAESEPVPVAEVSRVSRAMTICFSLCRSPQISFR